MSGYSALRARYCCIIGVWASAGASSFMVLMLVKLHLRLGLRADHARERVERHAPETVQRPDVLAVERNVEEPRDPALDAEFLARDEAHQLPDGVVRAERDERAEVAVAERPWDGGERRDEMARLLVRRLRARRNGLAVGPRARRAIADRVHVVVASGLQRIAREELVQAVGLEPVEILEHVGAADAGGPYGEIACDLLPGRGLHAGRGYLDHALAGEHLDVEIGQHLERALGDVVGQSRQDAGPRLDHRDADLLLGTEVIETVRGEHANRVV